MWEIVGNNKARIGYFRIKTKPNAKHSPWDGRTETQIRVRNRANQIHSEVAITEVVCFWELFRFKRPPSNL